MSKWYKVEYTEHSGYICVDDLISDLSGRVKITKRFYFDMETDPTTTTMVFNWCFKFKDEADAMAFKLRLL